MRKKTGLHCNWVSPGLQQPRQLRARNACYFPIKEADEISAYKIPLYLILGHDTVGYNKVFSS